PVDGTKSTLAVAPASIVANGTAMATLSFTARDVNNYLLTGRKVTFATSGTGAAGVKVGAVTESNGVYTATLTSGTTAGQVNVAVAVDGTTVSGTNNSKVVTLTSVANITGVVVNGKLLTVDVGAPDVGFPNAPFQIQINGGTATNSSYNWSVMPATAASVGANGDVKLLSGASSTTITIQATPKAGGSALEYKFKLKSWFEPMLGSYAFKDAINTCSAMGLVVPSIDNLINQWSVWGDSRGLGMPSTQWALATLGNTSQPSMNTVDASITYRNANGGAYAGVSCWKEL
ncbi:Ig-like domain-containing protein, partial [Lelliottia amnigena]